MLSVGVIFPRRKGTHAEITGSVVIPASHRVDQASGIQLLDTFGKFDLGEILRNLTPALVIDNLLIEISQGQKLDWKILHSYPSSDARETLELIDQQVKLAIKLNLLLRIGKDRARRAVGRVCLAL